MPDDTIHIEVRGMDELMRKMDKFPAEIKQTMEAAGREAAEEVLKTDGLRKYPPTTAANAPPAPYYIRGRGMQYMTGNTGSSEKLGTQWTVEPKGFKTTIANRASYAKWVHGEQQAHFMAPKGWRKLVEVGKEKTTEITRIYNLWVERLLKRIGLT